MVSGTSFDYSPKTYQETSNGRAAYLYLYQ